MADEAYSTKRQLSLRRLTRAVSELVRSQMKEYLTLLGPHFRAKPIFGEMMSGAKDYIKGAEANFKELKAAYESACQTAPFNAPKDFKTPLELTSETPELHVLEYTHEAKADGQTKQVNVTAPLKFVLTYTGFGPKQLKNLLGGAGTPSDVQEFILHTMILGIVLNRQSGVGKLLEALRFRISTAPVVGCGKLPFVHVTAAVPTVLPPDDVIIESTEISGTNAFEEVVDIKGLQGLRDPFKEAVLELARQHGEAIPEA